MYTEFQRKILVFKLQTIFLGTHKSHALVQVVHIQVTATTCVSSRSCFPLTTTLSMYFETNNFYARPRYLHIHNIQIRAFQSQYYVQA